MRIALNVAIDREAINGLVFDGLAVPRQASPTSISPQYHEGATKAYAFYNPDMANEYLDKAGYSERDANGFRKWKDGSGETLSFIVQSPQSPGSPSEDAAQMVMMYFADVGVNAAYKYFERGLMGQYYSSNEIESAWPGGGGHDTLPFILFANVWIGEKTDRPWAGAWGLWYRNGPDDPNGEPPPDGHFIWKMWELWEQAESEVDEGRCNALHDQITDIYAEEVPCIGVVGEKPGPIIVKNGLRNWVGVRYSGGEQGNEAWLGPPVLFWDQPEKHA